MYKFGSSKIFDEQTSADSLKLASKILTKCESKKKHNIAPIGFLQGCSGIYALHAVVLFQLGNENACKTQLKALFSISNHFSDMSVFENELMNGIAGYIAAILFVMKKLPISYFDIENVEKIFKICFAALCNSKGDLINFAWHKKEYYGAAHGLAGILYVMLLIPKFALHSDFSPKVKNSLSFLMSLQQEQGWFTPTRKGSPNTTPVFHWCHGTPGIIPVLLQAFKIYKEEKYLIAAKQASETLWKYGLLSKGFGLCHGISGNTYIFLYLYQITSDEIYLYRALSFFSSNFDSRALLHISCTIDRSRKVIGMPDHPHSLMEGCAGEGCLCIDTINYNEAAFPGYANDLYEFKQ